MHVAMLGPLEVRADSGADVGLRGTRLRALLIVLALQAGKVVTTSRLVDALWGEQPPAGVINALQSLVSRLRRAVPDVVVAAHPAGYQLVLSADQVDVFQFERLAADGHAELRADPGRASRTLRQALALWRGPALADVAGAGFAQVIAARLDELRLAAIQDRVEAELRLGVTGPLVPELEGLVAAHPLREPLIGQLMRALSGAGQPAGALAVYEQARSRLVEQLGTEPSAGLAEVHLEILRAGDAVPGPGGQPVPAPAWPAADRAPGQVTPGYATPGHGASADRTPPAAAPGARPDRRPPGSNLRAELTSFVGRDAELAEVGQLIGAHRLTTLTGPGGAGKTRLAVEAARAELEEMAGRVWLIELAPVTDPAEVAPTALACLGLREQALLRGARTGRAAELPADPLSRLVAALSDQQALLVLDNCEHLVAAAATLAYRVLGACPRVRIIATSREPLNITGEVLWPVRPLTLPPAGPAPDPAAISGCASVQLLVQRARAVQPGFAVTVANAGAVAHICRALDGMPLAIELAAARLRAMTPGQVASRLDDRFRLLTGGSRTALPRHQTLRAVVDWSWELLDEPERALWRRFSVFAGGATQAAAEQVCAGGGVAADQVLDLLTALVDKSLLTVRDGQDGPRYRMLEIIRAYGQQRLAQAGEQDKLRAAHAACYGGLAAQAAELLLGAEQLPWLRRLTDDQDNLHAAVRASVAAGDASTALGLAGSLGWYWWLRGLKAEGIELIGETLAVPGEAAGELRAVAYAMGALLSVDGEDERGVALEWFQAAADLAEQLPDPANPVLTLVGPLRAIYEATQKATGPFSLDPIDAAVASPDPWVGATARLIRGHMSLNFGRDHARAEADFEAALVTHRALGERWGMAFTMVSLAGLALWRGEFARAASYREQALELACELGTMEDVVVFRAQLAKERWLLGQREQAQAAITEATRDADRVGLPDLRALTRLTAGQLARLDGDLAAAGGHLAVADEIARQRSVSGQFRALIASEGGLLAGARGDLAAARARHAEALSAGRSARDAPVLAQALAGLADLAVREDDPARAAELLGASLAIRGMPDQSLVDDARVAAAARAALGDARYAAAYQRGQSVTQDTLDGLVGPVSPVSPATPGA